MLVVISKGGRKGGKETETERDEGKNIVREERERERGVIEE